MHVPSVLGKDTQTKAVQKIPRASPPWYLRRQLLAESCVSHFLAPNSVVPPSVTSPGTGQGSSRCKEMLYLRILWDANQLLLGVQPLPVVRAVLPQTARGGMGFSIPCHTGEGGVQARKASGAEFLLSFGVQGLRDMLWRGQL